MKLKSFYLPNPNTWGEEYSFITKFLENGKELLDEISSQTTAEQVASYTPASYRNHYGFPYLKEQENDIASSRINYKFYLPDYEKDEIIVAQDGNKLIIRSRDTDLKNTKRRFNVQFILAPGGEVAASHLLNGILVVRVKQQEKNPKEKQIPVT